MKKLIIQRNGKILEEYPLTKESLLMGRSPMADLVVRAPGVKPFHWLIETLADESEDIDDGDWTILDISDETVNPEGFVLSKKMLHIGGFDFVIREDRLAESDLSEGVLRKSIENTKSRPLKNSFGKLALEVSVLNKDLDLISEVRHIDVFANTLSFPSEKLHLNIQWSDKERKLIFTNLTAFEGKTIRNKGELINQKENFTGVFSLQSYDFLQISDDSKSFNFRLVSKESFIAKGQNLLRDPMVIIFFMTLALVLSFYFFIIYFAATPQEPTVIVPPRIVTIEVAKPISEVEVKEPEKIFEASETKIEPEKVSAQIPVKEKTNEPAASSRQAVITDGKKKTSGLNNNSELAKENTIGLSKLFAKSGTKTTGRVSADQILNQGIINTTATGEGGSIVVNQGPMGQLGASNNVGSSKVGDLASATTTLSGSDVADVKSTGPLGRPGGQSGFNLGTQADGLAGIGSNSKGSGLDGFGSGDNEITGGLDRDSVRRAIQAKAREFKSCYDYALLSKPGISGRMVFKWIITSAGSVTQIDLKASELKTPQFESCVENVIRSIRFPEAPSKASTIVTYPFVFAERGK